MSIVSSITMNSKSISVLRTSRNEREVGQADEAQGALSAERFAADVKMRELGQRHRNEVDAGSRANAVVADIKPSEIGQR